MQEKINNKIDSAFESIENIQRATAPDFFFTRLEARMLREKKNVWEKISSFIARPAVAFGCMAVILIMNSVFIFSNIVNDEGAVMANELATVDEYSQVSTGLYELENLRPQ